MTYIELEKEVRRFVPALVLESLLPHKVRQQAINILTPLSFLLLLPIVLGIAAKYLSVEMLDTAMLSIAPFASIYSGLFFIFIALDFVFIMLDAFYASNYFQALDSIISESGIAGTEPLSFEAASFFYHASPEDITVGMIRSPYGALLLARVGITSEMAEKFLASRTQKLPASTLNIESLDSEYGVTLVDIALLIFRQDKEFSQFLFSNNVQEKDLLGAAKWVERAARLSKTKDRWWSRDSLGRTPGIGKDWGYGGAYRLEKYATDITGKSISAVAYSSAYLRDEVLEVETTLSRTREANVIIVGEPGGGALDVVYRLSRMIGLGSAMPALEEKRMMLVDVNKLSAAAADKAAFENEFLSVLSDAVKAGNIILVIPDLPHLLETTKKIGADVMSLMDPFISSPHLQLIALSSPAKFHALIEPNTLIMKRFETVLVKAGGREGTISILEDEVSRFERSGKLFFTYPAIEAIADGAVRYFPDSIMPDKAVDLVSEIVPQAIEKGIVLVTKSDILGLIQTKTGIPTGEVQGEEREKLLNLEEFLHKRVVGQDAAVKAIANAMRRARSGIGNPNRPIGSFLFLGPTGVGKTETTKALAEAFFGNEEKVIRFDMSEYKSEDAMDKLIGSFDQGKPGILSSTLRENPYGVLLLDEFEKTTKEVMDLFLQVLDEGFFSDMSGKRVNARNLIIIATSNAGADLIWDIMRGGSDLLTHKDEVINAIVKNGTFKPELINRFDGVVLFHPIQNAELRKIAEIMLAKLKTRVRDRGIDLVINEALINDLMKFGADPKFGARPMNRAIQDKVEKIIADKLIKGEIKQGDTVEISEADLAQTD